MSLFTNYNKDRECTTDTGKDHPPLSEPLVKPFVLIGKAKTVFALIELKAKREQELKLAMENLRSGVTEADKIILDNLPTESDQHIADNMRDVWANMANGNED
jgi:hypothetical protein